MNATTTLPYYNFSKIFSYYGAFYLFILGARGTGKTYGAKKKGIKDGIRKGTQFIYLRRYKEELQAAKNTFFADVSAEFPEYDFRIQGQEGQYSHISQRDLKPSKREWHTIVYFVALSQGGQKKSVSYPKVTLVIFDEFIIMKGAIHYLPDEANLFNEFYSTVDRYKAKTRVLFLANASSIDNPYFIEWDIVPDQGQEWLVAHDGFIVCHFHDSAEFAGEVYKTPFGKFIQGTEYSKYAVGNEFADNNEMLVADKGHTARYRFTLETGKGTFSVWYDFKTGNYYGTKRRPGNEIMFTLLPEKMGEGKILWESNDKLLGMLRTAFRHGRFYFDEPQTRNIFREIFRRR
jgi:hypothetical protein